MQNLILQIPNKIFKILGSRYDISKSQNRQLNPKLTEQTLICFMLFYYTSIQPELVCKYYLTVFYNTKSRNDFHEIVICSDDN